MTDVSISAIAELASDAMRLSGYMESTIRQYLKVFRYLDEFCAGAPYSEETGRAFAESPKPDGTPYSHAYTLHRHKVASICDGVLAGKGVDLSAATKPSALPAPQSPDLAQALEAYRLDNADRGLAGSTCDYYNRLACEYLLYLEGVGVEEVGEADAASVLGFMALMSSKWPGTTTYHLASNFRPFLRWLGRDDLASALRLANPKREHRIVPMLNDADEEAVATTCCNGSVPAGDAAITLLALTTGMRACDIVALKIGDIDWRHMTIGIVQQKTRNPLTVPMGAALAEALGKYLLEERPEASCDNVFVRQKAPHAALSDHSAVYEATRRTLSKAGVEGGGTRLLRHNAASRMLRAGAPLPVIASVLGHADPDSTSIYMEADESSMAACVLPLPRGGRRG